MKKKIIALLLAVLTLLPLGACGEPNPPEEPTRDFILSENGSSNYAIVFARKDNYGEVGCAFNFYNDLGGSAVNGLSYINDSMSSESDANPDAYEIMIGDGNRTADDVVKNQLKSPKDYVILTQGNRIFVYSEYFASMQAAMQDLTSRIKSVDGKKVLSLPEKIYHKFDYPAQELKIAGNPIEKYVMVVAEDNEKDFGRAEKINEWLLENVGLELQINYETDPIDEYEILIGDTGRAEDTITPTLEKNTYKFSVEGKRLILAYNGYGVDLIDETLKHFADTSCDVWSVEGTEDAYSQFRYDNFAVGRMSDELLDSVSPGVLALLSECTYFEYCLQEGIKKGQKWVYSNSSKWVPQSGTFDAMLASGKYGANCAMAQAWVLVDLGIIPNGKHVWGGDYAEIKHVEDYGKYMTAVGTIYQWNQGMSVTFKDLYARGKIEAGDIFYVKGHTFVFLGDEKFMATGHDSKWHNGGESAPTDDSQHCVFDSWICDMKGCGDYGYTMQWIYRFDPDFVPKVYRNAAGKLVDNPLFDPATSMYYKAGVSSEAVKIVKGTLN